MDSDEKISVVSTLDLQTPESQVFIPTEIWSKIISFLPVDDRCRVEGVSHQMSEASKATWAQKKSLSIAEPMVDSTAKLATLLRRCGSHLEVVTIGRHIQLDTEAQLFQLCPNVKILTFANDASLLLARDASQSGFSLYQEATARVQSFLESLPKLMLLQYLVGQPANGDYAKYKIVSLKEFFPQPINLPNLQELYVPIGLRDVPTAGHIGELQQTPVLSVTVPMGLVSPDSNSPLYRIVNPFQLRQLEQLYIRLSPPMVPLFNAAVVTRLAQLLPNLNSLVLACGYDQEVFYMPVGCIDAIIGQFAQLRTLVIVCRTATVERVPVDLNPHQHRQVHLNIFVADYNLPDVPIHSGFIGYSHQVHIMPMPNGRYGEAIGFLSIFNHNEFDFDDQKCLQMVKMSSSLNADWDFFNGH